MDLSDALRDNAAIREFTDEPVPDEMLYRILETARFAPSGGNRQGWRVIAVRDAALKRRMRELYLPGWLEYMAMLTVFPGIRGGDRAGSADPPYQGSPPSIPTTELPSAPMPAERELRYRRDTRVTCMPACTGDQPAQMTGNRLFPATRGASRPLPWPRCSRCQPKWTGTELKPRTVLVRTMTSSSSSISQRGNRASVPARAMRPSSRASAAPRQK
jgi:Nitroreductase family